MSTLFTVTVQMKPDTGMSFFTRTLEDPAFEYDNNCLLIMEGKRVDTILAPGTWLCLNLQEEEEEEELEDGDQS